jgi:predicted ribonuclease YlaK
MFKAEGHIVANGSAGAGKTFIATYLALRDIFVYEKYDKVKFVRSAVSSRDQGFLPGNVDEKGAVFELAYKAIIGELFRRGDAYDILKLKGNIEFVTTSYLRGTTIRDCALIVDECQNMSYQELDTVITRVGENCRVFFCGDQFQADLKANGVENFYKVLENMNEFDFINFTVDDIVRSAFVKSYLTKKYEVHGDRHIS